MGLLYLLSFTPFLNLQKHNPANNQQQISPLRKNTFLFFRVFKKTTEKTKNPGEHGDVAGWCQENFRFPGLHGEGTSRKGLTRLKDGGGKIRNSMALMENFGGIQTWHKNGEWIAFLVNTWNIKIYIPRTQMTHILEDLTHKMEGQPSKKEVKLVPGIHDIRDICSFFKGDPLFSVFSNRFQGVWPQEP